MYKMIATNSNNCDRNTHSRFFRFRQVFLTPAASDSHETLV